MPVKTLSKCGIVRMIIVKIVLMTYVPHENLLKLFVAVRFLSAGTKSRGNITNISIKSSNN